MGDALEHLEISGFEQVAKKFVPLDNPEYLGSREKCRYCGMSEKSTFGSRRNAHTFPESLGNKNLFSLDECKNCNQIFGQYDNALTSSIGPLLTLGGVKGKKGVRQTGRSDSGFFLSSRPSSPGRSVNFRSNSFESVQLSFSPRSQNRVLTIALPQDKFVPLHAFKCLLKIALAIMPQELINDYDWILSVLRRRDALLPFVGPMTVGVSFASIMNAPPTLGGFLLKPRSEVPNLNPLVFLFVAGSVCFQTVLPSSSFCGQSTQVPSSRLFYSSNLAKPNGGYLKIAYEKMEQHDWSTLTPSHSVVSSLSLNF